MYLLSQLNNLPNACPHQRHTRHCLPSPLLVLTIACPHHCSSLPLSVPVNICAVAAVACQSHHPTAYSRQIRNAASDLPINSLPSFTNSCIESLPMLQIGCLREAVIFSSFAASSFPYLRSLPSVAFGNLVHVNSISAMGLLPMFLLEHLAAAIRKTSPPILPHHHATQQHMQSVPRHQTGDLQLH